MSAVDAYDVCRHLSRYRQKNGSSMNVTSPELGLLGVTREYLDELVKNGIVELYPLYEGGPLVKVALTDKGRRMALAPVRRR